MLVDDFGAHHAGQPLCREGGEGLFQPMPVRLDQTVLKGGAAGRGLGGEPGDDVPGEGAAAGPVFAHDEGGGAAEALPALGDLTGQGDPEEGVGFGSGQEIAGAAGSGLGGEVVPPPGVVERQIHEPRECDAAAGGSDLGADSGDQGGGAALDGSGRREAGGGRRGVVHTVDCSGGKKRNPRSDRNQNRGYLGGKTRARGVGLNISGPSRTD
jgi:hypothetical protein